MKPDSGGLPKKYSGFFTMNWSSGDADAMSTATDRVLLRPALPACCQDEEIEPGKPASTAASMPPISIPISSAFVETTPLTAPERRPASTSLRSFGR